jgi:hypothetical protein
MAGYVTADVMLLLHAARPVRGNENAAQITIISQIDTRAKGPQWLFAFKDSDKKSIGTMNREVRESLYSQLKNLKLIEFALRIWFVN